jgi:hypothetical protein
VTAAPVTRMGHVRARELLLSGCAICAVAGWGRVGMTTSAGALAAPRTATTVRADVTVTGSTASCAGLTRGQQLAAARLVFSGRFLVGPTVRLDGRDVLVSPARMRLSRYIKGRGPKLVRVTTAVTARRLIAEDAIEAQAGERWVIYTDSRHGPYETSTCGRSRRLPPLVGRPVRPPG